MRLGWRTREVHREPEAASWEPSVPGSPPGAALREGRACGLDVQCCCPPAGVSLGPVFSVRWGASTVTPGRGDALTTLDTLQ